MLVNMRDDEVLMINYLNDLKEVVVKKDVINRNSIKDTVFLDNLIKYMASVIGKLTTPNAIAEFMKKNGSIISNETVDSYVIDLGQDIKLGMEKTADKAGIKTFDDIEIIDTVFVVLYRVRHLQMKIVYASHDGRTIRYDLVHTLIILVHVDVHIGSKLICQIVTRIAQVICRCACRLGAHDALVQRHDLICHLIDVFNMKCYIIIISTHLILQLRCCCPDAISECLTLFYHRRTVCCRTCI